ncbi:putative ribonuclease H-like domain-containing protein, partial [Tanacetum coccineum]
IEAIGLFLASVSFMGFIVYEMDVKSAFLYGTIEEEVYVCQPPSFEDPQFPDKVYKVEKALYGLHQAHRAWLAGHERDDGIFISQDKYMADILKKFDFSSVKTTSTLIETNKALLKDEEAEDVDVHIYRSMIGSLMYLTASRHDIMFAVFACARFQVTPKVSYLHTMKRIFRYLKVQPKLGLWYPRDSPFDLEAFLDSDYARASLDRKSTTGGCQFLGKRLISWQCKKQIVVANSTTKAKYVAVANCCGQGNWSIKRLLQFAKIYNIIAYLHKSSEHQDFDEIVDFLNSYPIKYALTENPTIYVSQMKQFWSTTEVKIVRDESKIIAKVDRKKIVVDVPRDQGGASVHTRFERAFKLSHDSPLRGGNTPRGDEDRLTLNESMETCTKLSDRVLALEKVKTAQAKEIADLKKRVKKLEKKRKARTPQLKRRIFRAHVESSATKNLGHQDNVSKQGRNLAKDEGTSLFQDDAEDQGRNDEDLMNETSVYDYPEGFARPSVSITTAKPVTTAGEGVSIAREIPEEVSTAAPEMDVTLAEALVDLLKSGKTKERATQDEASNAVLREEFDNVQARIDADALLDARLQEKEREQFSVDEQARFLVETIATRKFFAAQRATKIRNKPPTKTQIRNKMITYLKHMGKYTHSQLKTKSLEEIQRLYKKEQQWIDDFVPMDSEEGGKKAASKDAAEKEGLKAYLKIVPDEDKAINYDTLATKYPIVDWESQIIGSDLQGNDLIYWKITRADGSSKFYKVFSMMLDDFDKQDLVDLHRLVKERSASRALEGYDLIL